MHRRTVRLSLAPLLLTALLATSNVAADVVGAPPDDCPKGSSPASCHGGPYCSPNPCETDTDCGSGESCEQRSFCVSTVNCAGMLADGEDPAKYDRMTVERSCNDSSDCGPKSCESLKVCVSRQSSGGSCSLSPPRTTESSVSSAWLLALTLGAAGLAGRRSNAVHR